MAVDGIVVIGRITTGAKLDTIKLPTPGTNVCGTPTFATNETKFKFTVEGTNATGSTKVGS